MEINARECPYCHRPVSLKVCAKYLLRGTAYTIRCNHCDTELALIREPIPFKWCCCAGFISTAIPAEYFLFIKRLGLIRSLGYAAVIGMIVLFIISVMILKNCRFKVTEI